MSFWCDSDGKVLASADSFVYENLGKWYIAKDEPKLQIISEAYGSVPVTFERDSQNFVMTYNGFEFEVSKGITVGFNVLNYE